MLDGEGIVMLAVNFHGAENEVRQGQFIKGRNFFASVCGVGNCRGHGRKTRFGRKSKCTGLTKKDNGRGRAFFGLGQLPA